MAPTKVVGEDGRELAENLSDQDALELARKVHENTGETVSLVPFTLTDDGWVFDEDADARVYPPEQDEEETAEPDLSELKVPELRALAAERGVDVPAKAKKADLLAALEAA